MITLNTLTTKYGQLSVTEIRTKLQKLISDSLTTDKNNSQIVDLLQYLHLLKFQDKDTEPNKEIVVVTGATLKKNNDELFVNAVSIHGGLKMGLIQNIDLTLGIIESNKYIFTLIPESEKDTYRILHDYRRNTEASKKSRYQRS